MNESMGGVWSSCLDCGSLEDSLLVYEEEGQGGKQPTRRGTRTTKHTTGRWQAGKDLGSEPRVTARRAGERGGLGQSQCGCRELILVWMGLSPHPGLRTAKSGL